MSSKKKSLVLFTRDLRLEDNLMLHAASVEAQSILPLFVFKKEQIDKNKNEYFSEQAFAFLLDSLNDLSSQLRADNKELYFYKGLYQDALHLAHEHHKITDVYISEDVTPFAKKREQKIASICKNIGVNFHVVDNHFLAKPGTVATGDGNMYKVFTPFKNKAREQQVPKPVGALDPMIFETSNHFEHNWENLVNRPNTGSLFLGGRAEGLRQMEHVKNLIDYKVERDFMNTDGTSRLSPHIKFGTISSREFYRDVVLKFGPEHNLITELYWRDFYAHLAFAFPYVFGNAFNKKYAEMKWEESDEDLQSWKDGMTGYPIVDAGMRQLNTTGWMHNRARMIVASFLTKHLLIDWREGEKYFAQKLVDYDPATNNGSWQWAASTGADAQPYFRIFNPWSQQEKFDKECEYIREFVPELSALSNKEIHKYAEATVPVEGYVLPIVEHKVARERALSRFKSIK